MNVSQTGPDVGVPRTQGLPRDWPPWKLGAQLAAKLKAAESKQLASSPSNWRLWEFTLSNVNSGQLLSNKTFCLILALKTEDSLSTSNSSVGKGLIPFPCCYCTAHIRNSPGRGTEAPGEGERKCRGEPGPNQTACAPPHSVQVLMHPCTIRQTRMNFLVWQEAQKD